ncbi:MAG TPA: pilus assembly protein TadG-related protein [Bryobacteraceae bacterium]|nr:pilus assembly protein TadG-related protein [Bryobacteraceae bacterium]
MSSRTEREKGYVLITTALLLLVVLAITGLSFDIGRLYISRNEAQTYADAAALAAAKTLDGTLAGINSARNAALSVGDRHNFSSTAFSGTVVEFSTAAAGPWSAAPGSAAGVRFARVIAQAPTSLYFLPVVGGIPYSTNPAASAVAGQVPQTRFKDGLFPFSPFTINSAAPHYGLQRCIDFPTQNCVGSYYALRWPPGNFNNQTAMRLQGNNVNGNVCPGDFNQVSVNKAIAAASDVRGYYGPYGNASVQRDAIINDEIPAGLTLHIGTNLEMNGGGMQTQSDSIQERVRQDTDPTSRTYAQYLSRLDGSGHRVGNGRRVIGTPLNSGPPDYTVIAIAGFFLLPEAWYNGGGNQPLCAEYIGPFTLGAGIGGVAQSGSWSVRLVQ